jgi:hypothetical protein
MICQRLDHNDSEEITLTRIGISRHFDPIRMISGDPVQDRSRQATPTPTVTHPVKMVVVLSGLAGVASVALVIVGSPKLACHCGSVGVHLLDRRRSAYRHPIDLGYQFRDRQTSERWTRCVRRCALSLSLVENCRHDNPKVEHNADQANDGHRGSVHLTASG